MAGDPQFYDLNPIQVIDQNAWTVYHPEVAVQFREKSLYTPLVQWEADLQPYSTTSVVDFEMFPGDVVPNELPMTANYVDNSFVPDTRFRKWNVKRYGGKVMYHKSSSYFNQFRVGGTNDWRPMLRSQLGYHIIETHEKLSRQAFFQLPSTYWRYANGGSSFASLTSGSYKFELDEIDYWNFALGNTGSPIVPGDAAAAKLAIIPPGAQYDLMKAVATATGNSLSLWRDAQIYGGASGGVLRNEIGAFKNVRFVSAPNDEFGVNPNVLYNAGAITKQYGVTLPIRAGDGSPDPETTAVDSVWYVGQKNVTHFIQLENFTGGDFSVNDWVTIHIGRTSTYGITNGVDPFHFKTITRRVVAVDAGANTLAFDRPISIPYEAAFTGQSDTGATPGTFYAYVTRGKHIGFALVMGARGGVRAKVMKPIELYEPDPVDDFKSVWRFTYDEILGMNLADPNMYLLYFFTVSLPKPGGVISP
jgi:hypothetical protein